MFLHVQKRKNLLIDKPLNKVLALRFFAAALILAAVIVVLITVSAGASGDCQKNYEMIITGERKSEGGQRAIIKRGNQTLCFAETSSGQYRFRPLYYVKDKDNS